MADERFRPETGMKVTDIRNNHIGTIVKAGGKSSKVRIPIFGRTDYVTKQIPNRYLKKR